MTRKQWIGGAVLWGLAEGFLIWLCQALGKINFVKTPAAAVAIGLGLAVVATLIVIACVWKRL